MSRACQLIDCVRGQPWLTCRLIVLLTTISCARALFREVEGVSGRAMGELGGVLLGGMIGTSSGGLSSLGLGVHVGDWNVLARDKALWTALISHFLQWCHDRFRLGGRTSASHIDLKLAFNTRSLW